MFSQPLSCFINPSRGTASTAAASRTHRVAGLNNGSSLSTNRKASQQRILLIAAACISLILASSSPLDAFFRLPQGDDSPAGVWQGSLRTKGGELKFQFSLQQNEEGVWSSFLINGSERIKVPTTTLTGKSLKLDIDHYDSSLNLEIVSPTAMKGKWKRVRAKGKTSTLTIKATRSSNPPKGKTKDSAKQPTPFDGKWKVNFESSEDPAVGVFEADKVSGIASGTFLTTTGDYRYLAGTVRGDQLKLSCFDGSHAFLFHAKVQPDGSLLGDFWSGNHWHETWTAVADADMALPDSFSQTKVVAKSDLESLSFPDLDGKPTRLGDPKFASPVRIYHIFGSWCPNCHDAAAFLAELEAKYGDKLSVVGLAFELTGDLKRDAQQVRLYMKRYNLKHPILVAGLSDKAIASAAIPVLDKVRSYPTSLFVDEQGKVIAVHTGFSGPATGQAYQDLRKKYFQTIDSMLKAAEK